MRTSSKVTKKRGFTKDRKGPKQQQAPGMATCMTLRPFKPRAVGTEESREHDSVSGTPKWTRHTPKMPAQKKELTLNLNPKPKP
jgi:hypothetical protein